MPFRKFLMQYLGNQKPIQFNHQVFLLTPSLTLNPEATGTHVMIRCIELFKSFL